MDAKDILIVAVIIVLLLVFSSQITYLLSSFKNAIVSVFTGQKPNQVGCLLPDDDDIEHLEEPVAKPEPNESDTLTALGYTGSLPWDEVLQASELDPATHINHKEFVKDVKRFSNGANFTSVTDDNTNMAFTNFRGLRRPEHVPIGPGARQVPDIDDTVLQRNKVFRW